MFSKADLLTVSFLSRSNITFYKQLEAEPLNECQSCFRDSNNLITVHQEVNHPAGKTTIHSVSPRRCQNRGQLLGRISATCIKGTSPARPSSLSLDVWSLGSRSIIRVYCDCYKSIEEKGALRVDWEGAWSKCGDNQTIKHAHIKSD